MDPDNTTKNFTPSTLIIFIIVMALIGLTVSLFILNEEIRPYEGQRNYSVTFPAQDSVFMVDSFRLAKMNITDSLLLKREAELIKRADSLSKKDTILVRVKRFNSSNITLNHNPSLLVWMMSIGMMVATACGLVIPLIVQIIKLIRTFKPPTAGMGIPLLLIIVIGLVLFFVRGDIPLLSAFDIITDFQIMLQDTDELLVMIGVTMGIGLIAVLGMLIVNFCISRLENFYTDEPAKQADMFHFLNDSLRFFLISVSVLILYSVITTALIQQSIDGVIKVKQFPLFPSQFIYAYGLSFTIFLAIFYLPIHYHLRLEGKRISGMLIELYKDKPNEEEIRKFDMNEPTAKSIQVFLAILAPVLGSVFTELLKNVSP